VLKISKQKELNFRKALVAEYLKYGSVDEVFIRSKLRLPISYSHYQRVLAEWGIVKSAGTNKDMGETLELLSRYIAKKIGWSGLSGKFSHRCSFSLMTVYRILSFMRNGLTRRKATALILTPYKNEDKILVGNDVSLVRNSPYKPYGCVTIPVCFSKNNEAREKSILRVLQQEVFAKEAIEARMPNLIPKKPTPFMFLEIADIKVEVFHISLPKNLSSEKVFSSFKIKNFKFAEKNRIINGEVKNLRPGVLEIVRGFDKFLKEENFGNYLPISVKSELNLSYSFGF